MKYITFPASQLSEVSQETLDHFHLSPRLSVDGSQVIMKVDNYEKLFPSPMILPEEGEEYQGPVYPFPVYEGKGLEELLNSPEWTSQEDIT